MMKRGHKKQVMSLDAFRSEPAATTTATPRKMWGAASVTPAPSIKFDDIARQQEIEEKELAVARDAANRKAIEDARIAEIKRQELAEQERQRIIDEAKRWEEERPQREALEQQQEQERLQRQREEDERLLQEAKEREKKVRARLQRERIAATTKHKNGIKKLLQMTPEMHEYLDLFKGFVEFSWSRNRHGDHELSFEMEDTLSCDADFRYGSDYDCGTEVCDLTVTHAVSSPILKGHLTKIAKNLFFGVSSSIERNLLNKIGRHLLQTDSADACLPTASLATRTAIDDWIDYHAAAQALAVQRAEQLKKSMGFSNWSTPRFELSETEIDVFRTLLVTHKASFSDELSKQIDAAQKTVAAVDQVHAHVAGINANLDCTHVDGCAAASSAKPKCNCRARLTQERFNHWDGLVGLTSIPLAILFVLLGRSGRNDRSDNIFGWMFC